MRDGEVSEVKLPKGEGVWDQTTYDFSLSNYKCITVEYHYILLLNNPSSSLLITNRYHSSRMNNLRKKSLNKSQLIAFLKKSNFLMFLLRAEQQYSQRINYLSFFFKKKLQNTTFAFLKGLQTFPFLSIRITWKGCKVIQSTIHCTQAAFDYIALQTRYFAGKHKTVYH